MDSEEIRAASRRKRAERKLAQQRAVAGGPWTRCLYKVPGKERYCAQHRSKLNAKYCGTHMGETEEKGRRVPCPVDPNHTVFEHHLAAHAKICNLTILQARMEAQPYYSKGINSGPPLPEEEQEVKEERGGASDAAFDEAFLLDLIARVAAAHRDLIGEIPTEVLDHIPEVQPLHRTLTEDGKGFRKGRHVLQHASLVGHLVKRGLAGPVDSDNNDNSSSWTVNNRPTVLHVEMGAGKGALGQSIAAAFPGAEVTMVERSSVRRKAENRLDGVSARARIDIRDLNMAGLPSLAPCGEEANGGSSGSGRGGKPVVAVAKHLCGVATDLALRAMLTLSPTGPPRASREGGTSGVDGGGGGGGGETAVAPSIPSAAAAASRVGGVAVATCCHHVCSWRDYVGRDFLSRQGFTSRDFEAMRRISAWISLEPDAGARKNNKYPDEKHPAAAAATADSTLTPPLPPPSSSEIPAATAPPAIAEEEDVSSEITDSSERGATSPPAATTSLATGAAGPPSLGVASASPSSLTPPPTTVSPTPCSLAAAAPPQACLPVTSIPDTTVTRRRNDQSAAKAADESDDDDDHNDLHQRDHAPPRIQPTPAAVTAATTTTPAPSTAEGEAAAAAAAAVVAARAPKPLLALPGLTPAEKARTARECKRLIDRGRRAFIEERLGLASELVHFVGREVTPENALLLGFCREGGLSG